MNHSPANLGSLLDMARVKIQVSVESIDLRANTLLKNRQIQLMPVTHGCITIMSASGSKH